MPAHRANRVLAFRRCAEDFKNLVSLASARINRRREKYPEHIPCAPSREVRSPRREPREILLIRPRDADQFHQPVHTPREQGLRAIRRPERLAFPSGLERQTIEQLPSALDRRSEAGKENLEKLQPCRGVHAAEKSEGRLFEFPARVLLEVPMIVFAEDRAGICAHFLRQPPGRSEPDSDPVLVLQFPEFGFGLFGCEHDQFFGECFFTRPRASRAGRKRGGSSHAHAPLVRGRAAPRHRE